MSPASSASKVRGCVLHSRHEALPSLVEVFSIFATPWVVSRTCIDVPREKTSSCPAHRGREPAPPRRRTGSKGESAVRKMGPIRSRAGWRVVAEPLLFRRERDLPVIGDNASGGRAGPRRSGRCRQLVAVIEVARRARDFLDATDRRVKWPEGPDLTIGHCTFRFLFFAMSSPPHRHRVLRRAAAVARADGGLRLVRYRDCSGSSFHDHKTRYSARAGVAGRCSTPAPHGGETVGVLLRVPGQRRPIPCTS